MMRNRRVAAIDAGSNAIRLLVADVLASDPSQQPLVKKVGFYRVPLAIGESVFRCGMMMDDDMDRLRHVMWGIHHWLQVFQPDECQGVATSAFRDAQNGEAVIEALGMETGLPIRVISGVEEAQLIVKAWPPTAWTGYRLYVDIGGGSTELTAFDGDRLLAQTSVPLGALRLLNQPDGDDAMAGFDSVYRFIQGLPIAKWCVVGTGGNVSKLPSMLRIKDGELIRLKKIRMIWETLKPMAPTERMLLYSLKPDRATSIEPALHILTTIMTWVRANELQIPKCGLVDGLAMSMATMACSV